MPRTFRGIRDHLEKTARMTFEEMAEYWDEAFREQRELAYDYLERHNSALPTQACPGCKKLRHLPGLACPRCGYCHPISVARVRDTEWGYQVVSIGVLNVVFAEFRVEESDE